MKRVTKNRILDAIGCPNLHLTKEYNADALYGERKQYFCFEYIKSDAIFGDVEILGRLDVDHQKLNDLTLEQWVENGQKLVEEVETQA